MPPRITLVLCIVFIIVLFVQDRKYRQAETTWALWIPLLFMLILASRPLALWLNPGLLSALPENASDGSPADRNFFIFLIASGLFILFKRRLNWPYVLKSNLWAFILFIYCGFSIIWSDTPRASLNAWVKVMLVPLMALVILTEPDIVGATRTVLKRTTYILIPLSVVLIKYFPAYGRSYSLHSGTPFYGGVTTYKNGLGVLCFITGLFLVWDLIYMFRNKSLLKSKTPLLVNIVLIAMIFWLLTMAQSATAAAVFIVGTFVLIIMEMPILKNNIKKLDIVMFSLIFLTLLIFLSFNALEGIITSLGRDMTLTGRTVIWKKVLGIDINPIIGTGYGSFWLGERGEFLLDLNWQKLTQAHNGYIETYLNLGFIGLSLLIMMIIKTYKNIKISLVENFQYGKLELTYMVVFLLTNVTEATFVIKSTEWFIFVLISIHASACKQKSIVKDSQPITQLI